MSETIAQPIVSEVVSPSDLIRLIAPRLLKRCPALSRQECVIDIAYIPGRGLRISVLGILARDGE
jgi:hypothetical protein